MTTPSPPESPTVRARIPITLERHGAVRAEVLSFRNLVDSGEHVAIVVGDVSGRSPLVRVHSECLTGDIFGSRRCDCGPQLDDAMRQISVAGGVLLYLRQEGRGIGLYNKLDAYVLQDQHVDTFEANRMLGRGADERSYFVAAQMLCALGINSVRLLTNNPAKTDDLRASAIEVAEVIPTRVHTNPENLNYLRAKSTVGGHTIRVPGLNGG